MTQQSSIVQKLLKVLEVVSDAQAPLSFSQVVEKTGLNKSTIHRLLALAVEEKLLRYDTHGKVYALGARIYDLVRNAHNGFDIQSFAMDEMVRLYDRYDVNVTIAIPNGLEVVSLRILEAPNSMGGIQRPGMRDPIHCAASGKALLAYYPENALTALLDGYDFVAYTDKTIRDFDTYAQELREVRVAGYAKNDREQFNNFLGIAAPVFNYLGEPIAVLNLWSVYPRHTMQDMVGWAPDLIAAAQSVTGRVGGVAPNVAELSPQT